MQVPPPQQPAPQRPSRQLTDASGLPVRGPLKGALVVLVLLMLGVLIWQLRKIPKAEAEAYRSGEISG